ncbi:MAG: hypothetical protein Q9180_008569, partial [Flavoplaca navasiana]
MAQGMAFAKRLVEAFLTGFAIASSCLVETVGQLVRSVNITSQELTSTLSILSAAVTNGTPLPPYLQALQRYKLSTKLEAIDADILHISQITESGYAAFAVMQRASSLISDDM